MLSWLLVGRKGTTKWTLTGTDTPTKHQGRNLMGKTESNDAAIVGLSHSLDGYVRVCVCVWGFVHSPKEITSSNIYIYIQNTSYMHFELKLDVYFDTSICATIRKDNKKKVPWTHGNPKSHDLSSVSFIPIHFDDYTYVYIYIHGYIFSLGMSSQCVWRWISLFFVISPSWDSDIWRSGDFCFKKFQ